MRSTHRIVRACVPVPPPLAGVCRARGDRRGRLFLGGAHGRARRQRKVRPRGAWRAARPESLQHLHTTPCCVCRACRAALLLLRITPPHPRASQQRAPARTRSLALSRSVKSCPRRARAADCQWPRAAQDAITRANLYFDAGADAVYVEAPISRQELKLIGQKVNGLKVRRQPLRPVGWRAGARAMHRTLCARTSSASCAV